ncbi:MAG: thioredoxin family protein [Ignavibacteria bacterium]|nr:thioredoxin family protein [Ignavibacteria bacterium]
MKKHLILSLIILTSIVTLSSEPMQIVERAKFSLSTKAPRELKLKAGDTVSVPLTITIDKGWHAYDMQQEERNKKSAMGMGPMALSVSQRKSTNFKIGKVLAPKSELGYDSTFEVPIGEYHGKIDLKIPVLVKRTLKIGSYNDSIEVSIQVCNVEGICTNLIKLFPVKFVITAESVGALVEPETTTPVESPAITQAVSTSHGTHLCNLADCDCKCDLCKDARKSADSLKASSQPSTKSDTSTSQGGSNTVTTKSGQQIDDVKKKGVWSFLWFAMTAGAAALLTPCVFPMVPITVSFFTKRSEKEKSKGLRDSIVYALGIIGTFTGLGILLAVLLGAAGIQDFAANPWVNVGIAVIFLVFAMNLFGAFEIQIPTSILNKLNMASTGSGLTSVLLMGLTFSLTSFTCTVPFVGSALIAAADGEWFYPIIGMLGFSGTFAIPFFLLALFPSKLSKLPKAGGWMNNMKVVMGFLEIAAAMKFISNFEMAWKWGILPRDMFLAVWIGCSILIVIYVLGVYRLKLDSPVSNVSAFRIVWAIFFATITIYLMTGLFGGKTLGTLEAFLPSPDYELIIGGGDATVTPIPPKVGGKNNAAVEEEWFADYKTALAEAKRLNKPIFIDFTGVFCTNCRWMETNVFVKPAVKNLMDDLVRVRLYTDRKSDADNWNKDMMMKRFNSIELPLYAIVSPDDKILETQSFTRNQAEFIEFINKGSGKK